MNLQLSMTAYRLAGLRIVSDMPLPGLTPCNGDGVAAADQVVIRRSRVPEALAPVRKIFANGQCNEHEFLLNIPDVGRYLVRQGTEILVEPAPYSATEELHGYLLGTMLGVLCHQRGIMPLHASAIDVADGCVAFVGESGAGKSTLVAALAARGHQIMTDDLCFLRVGDEQNVEGWPGIHRIRLWEDSMSALGIDEAGAERVWRRWNKYYIPVRPPQDPVKPRRVRRIYQLHAARDARSARVERLQGAAAIEVLMQHVYRLGLAEYMGYKPAAFMICAAMASHVPVFRFSRPLRFGVLRQGLELLEDHLRDLR